MSTAPSATTPVTPETMLPHLFRAHPETRAVFDRYGLKGCGGKQSPAETIQFFSRTHGVEGGACWRRFAKRSFADRSPRP